MPPKATYKELMYADYLLYGRKSNYCLPLQIPFPGRYYICRCTESEYLADHITIYSKHMITWNSITVVFCPDCVCHRYGMAVYASKFTICYYRWVSLSVIDGETHATLHMQL